MAKGDICQRCNNPSSSARWYQKLGLHLCKSCHAPHVARPLLKCEDCGKEGGVRKIDGRRRCKRCRDAVNAPRCDKCKGTDQVRKMRSQPERLCKKCRRGHYQQPFTKYCEAEQAYEALRSRSSLHLPRFTRVLLELVLEEPRSLAQRGDTYGCKRQRVHQLDAKYFNQDIQAQYRARHGL